MKKSILLIVTFLLACTQLWAQGGRLSGRVVTEGGEPILGAAVVVKENPAIGTTTDLNGEFALSRVEFTITPDKLTFLDKKMKPIVESGEFIVMVGTSSEDDRLIKKSFFVE